MSEERSTRSRSREAEPSPDQQQLGIRILHEFKAQKSLCWGQVGGQRRTYNEQDIYKSLGKLYQLKVVLDGAVAVSDEDKASAEKHFNNLIGKTVVRFKKAFNKRRTADQILLACKRSRLSPGSTQLIDQLQPRADTEGSPDGARAEPGGSQEGEERAEESEVGSRSGDEESDASLSDLESGDTDSDETVVEDFTTLAGPSEGARPPFNRSAYPPARRNLDDQLSLLESLPESPSMSQQQRSPPPGYAVSGPPQGPRLPSPNNANGGAGAAVMRPPNAVPVQRPQGPPPSPNTMAANHQAALNAAQAATAQAQQAARDAREALAAATARAAQNAQELQQAREAQTQLADQAAQALQMAQAAQAAAQQAQTAQLAQAAQSAQALQAAQAAQAQAQAAAGNNGYLAHPIANGQRF